MIDLGINLFQEIAALGGGGGGYSISNSVRFNDDDAARLTRTPSVAGNRRTFTFSAWVKRGNVGDTVFGNLFSVRDASTTRTVLRINADSLDWLDDDINFRLLTSAKLRDVGGWYHIVATADTTQATTSDRLKIYINGVRVSSFSTSSYPSQNYETEINNTRLHALGVEGSTTNDYFDGYMADVNFIDGQALTADDFGEINADTGEWSPKKYSGTYGTNGFYLEFKDGAALGDDTSGNTNDWTPTNLASTDQMLDTPTNNFDVLNPLDKGSNVVLSNGNLQINIPSGIAEMSRSTIGMSSGKWYSEWLFTGGTNSNIGIATSQATLNNFLAFDAYGWIYYINGQKYTNNAGSAYGAAYTVNDIIGVAFDADNGTLTFYKNGVSQGVAFTGLTSGPYYFAQGTINGDGLFNFGQDSSFAGNKTRQGNTDANGIGDFYYTPPTGYLALCTDNLPEPAIVDSETQFNVVTYTGNGGTLDVDVGFQPDFVWTKSRTNTYVHGLWDTVRGVGKHLMSNLTNAEVTNDPDGYLSAFNPNGFTLSAGSSSSATWNLSGGSYVAWCWKAGGTAVTNTDGTETVLLSANQDAGFSIVKWTTRGSGITMGHGLGATPQFIINKQINRASSWDVQANYFDATSYYLYLNTTAASIGPYGNAATDTVFNTFDSGTGDEYISYVFAPKEGFSKFGSYVGNGSTDGPFIYTGFRPAFVLVKSSSLAGSYWHIMDAKRNEYNVADKLLYPNDADAEGTGLQKDFLSNGFKIRSTATWANGSGQTYIYMAFAEAPFKNAVAR